MPEKPMFGPKTDLGYDEPHMKRHTLRYTDSAASATDEIARVAERWRFVLATDLDGTFLGGSEGERALLYRWIEDNREDMGLIFVTGRDPGFIAELARGPVPAPDFVVGDVGTTIAHVTPIGDVIPIPELEEAIAERWADRGGEVRGRLDGHPGLTLQPTEFRHRVSYDMDPVAFDPGAKDIVAGMGLDWLISADRFFDVLPKGVSKGPSLTRLIGHLGVPGERVLVAGDTLNDLSLFETAFRGVAVGNSEPDLIALVRDNENVHKATGAGAAGIVEAIARFQMYEPTPGG